MSDAVDFVEVGGKEYRIVKTGRAQAAQVVALTRWISRYGARAAKDIATDGGDVSGMEVISRFIEHLDEDALIDLFGALIGCPKEDSEVYFDIAILVDAAIAVYEKQPSVRKLIDRFFSIRNSASNTEEPSTKSE